MANAIDMPYEAIPSQERDNVKSDFSDIPVPERIQIKGDPGLFWKINVPKDDDLIWSICLSLLIDPCANHTQNHLEHLEKLYWNKFHTSLVKWSFLQKFNPFEEEYAFFTDKPVTDMISCFQAAIKCMDDSENVSAVSDDVQQVQSANYESIVKTASKILKCAIDVYERYSYPITFHRIFTWPDKLQDWKKCSCIVVLIKNDEELSERCRFSFVLKQKIASELRQKALIKIFNLFLRGKEQPISKAFENEDNEQLTGKESENEGNEQSSRKESEDEDQRQSASKMSEDKVTDIYDLPGADTYLLISLLRNKRFNVVKELFKQPRHIFERLSAAGFIVNPLIKWDSFDNKSAFFYAVLSSDFDLLCQLYSSVTNNSEWSMISIRQPNEESSKIYNRLTDTLTETKQQIQALECDQEEKKKHSHHIQVLCKIHKFQHELYNKLYQDFIKSHFEGRDQQENAERQKNNLLGAISLYENFFNSPDSAQNNNSTDFDTYKEYSDYFYYIDRLSALKFFDHSFFLKYTLAVEENAYEKMESAFCRLFFFDDVLTNMGVTNSPAVQVSPGTSWCHLGPQNEDWGSRINVCRQASHVLVTPLLTNRTKFSDSSVHILKYLNRTQFKSELEEFKQYLKETKRESLTKSKSHHVKESKSQRDEVKESANQNDEVKESASQNDEVKESTSQNDEDKESSQKDEVKVATSQKDEVKVATSQKDEVEKSKSKIDIDVLRSIPQMKDEFLLQRLKHYLNLAIQLNFDTYSDEINRLVIQRTFQVFGESMIQTVEVKPMLIKSLLASAYPLKVVKDLKKIRNGLSHCETKLIWTWDDVNAIDLKALQGELRSLSDKLNYIECIQEYRIRKWIFEMILNLKECENVLNYVSGNDSLNFQEEMETAKTDMESLKTDFLKKSQKLWRKYEAHFKNHEEQITNYYKSEIQPDENKKFVPIANAKLQCYKCLLEFLVLEFSDISSTSSLGTVNVKKCTDIKRELSNYSSLSVTVSNLKEAEKKLTYLKKLKDEAFIAMGFCNIAIQSQACSYDEDEKEILYPAISIMCQAFEDQYFLSVDEKEKVFSSVEQKYKLHHETIVKLINSLKSGKRLSSESLKLELRNILYINEKTRDKLQKSYLHHERETAINKLKKLYDLYGNLLNAINNNELKSWLCDKICEDFNFSEEIKRILQKLSNKSNQNEENSKTASLHHFKETVFFLKKIVVDLSFKDRVFLVKCCNTYILMGIFLSTINKSIECRIEPLGKCGENKVICSRHLIKFLDKFHGETGFRKHKVLFSLRKEPEVQAAVEMLFLHCANIMQLKKNKFKDLLIKVERLLSGISLRNTLAHGNPLLEAICTFLDPHDLLSEINKKVFELISDYEAIEAMSNLQNEIKLYFSDFVNKIESDENDEFHDFRRTAKLCSRWKDYAALIPEGEDEVKKKRRKRKKNARPREESKNAEFGEGCA